MCSKGNFQTYQDAQGCPATAETQWDSARDQPLVCPAIPCHRRQLHSSASHNGRPPAPCCPLHTPPCMLCNRPMHFPKAMLNKLQRKRIQNRNREVTKPRLRLAPRQETENGCAMIKSRPRYRCWRKSLAARDKGTGEANQGWQLDLAIRAMLALTLPKMKLRQRQRG